jgi:hypothetical protein
MYGVEYHYSCGGPGESASPQQRIASQRNTPQETPYEAVDFPVDVNRRVCVIHEMNKWRECVS